MVPDREQGEETAAMLTVAVALYESQDNYSPRQARVWSIHAQIRGTCCSWVSTEATGVSGSGSMTHTRSRLGLW